MKEVLLFLLLQATFHSYEHKKELIKIKPDYEKKIALLEMAEKFKMGDR